VTAPIGEPEPRRGGRAQSPIGLRLIAAVFGLVVCLAGGLLVLLSPMPTAFGVVLLALALVSVGDLVVVLRRKARGEPG
jgi:hypothetical protein